MYKKYITSAAILIIFISDQVLKYYFRNLLSGEVFSFLPGLKFSYSLNPSLFFFPAWSFIPWLALIILIILVLWYGIGVAARIGIVSRFSLLNRITTPPHYTSRYTATHTQLLPIILGGLSNVFDRLAYGGVVDYVEISSIARINLADILILAGLLGLIFKTKKSQFS